MPQRLCASGLLNTTLISVDQHLAMLITAALLPLAGIRFLSLCIIGVEHFRKLQRFGNIFLNKHLHAF